MGREYQQRILVMGQIPQLGNIILHDDMEYLLKWAATGGGTPAVTKDNTKAYNGDNSLKIATSAGGTDWTQAQRLAYMLPYFLVSYECVFTLAGSGGIDTLEFEISWNDGGYAHVSAVRYDQASHKWQMETGAAVWTDITGATKTLNVNTWHRLKWIINQNTHEYVSLAIDGFEYDLSGNGYYYAVSAGAVWSEIEIRVYNAGAVAQTVNVDELLVLAE